MNRCTRFCDDVFVPTISDLKIVCSTPSSALLFQFLIRKFRECRGGPVPMFEVACPQHKSYTIGNSFSEVLAFSPKKFRAAFNDIGILFYNYKTFSNAEDFSEIKFFRAYYEDLSGSMWIFIDFDAVNDLLDYILEQHRTDSDRKTEVLDAETSEQF